MSENNEAVEKLLGDFFERHTAGDKEGMASVLQDIQLKLKSGEVSSEPFKEYFNNMYAGRGAVNVQSVMSDYPRESIIRELLQNVFGCDYDSSDIKVMIEFLDEGQVKLIYNETGFKLEQVFYYLSVGRNEGESEREGRFGLGAKSVFANCDWFKMRSNNYQLRVVNDNGTLKVRELDLNAPMFKHTEVVFSLPEEEQKRLHRNLVTLTSEKGEYLNMVDLCFAFIRKKHLKAEDTEEAPSRTFNIAVLSYGKQEMVYKIQEFRRDENDIPKVRFSENGKSIADFIHSERDGFVYLIPFAVSGAKREAAKVLMSKYNYFSTFELTGFVKANTAEFIDEKLSAFFVSVPNKYITNNRSGIRHDAMEEVSRSIEEGVLAVVEQYGKLFVLELVPHPENSERFMLRPRTYVFEFFYNYATTTSLVSSLKEKFCDNISVKFPNAEEPVLFTELKENGYFTEHNEISKEEHEDGSAAALIAEDIEQMNKWYGKDDNHVLMSRYRWSVPGTDEGGSEYLYSFYRDGGNYLMDSALKHVKDYDLSAGFKNIIALKLNNCVVNGQVADEDALAETFSVIDEMFGESYRIGLRYFDLVITSGSTSIQFEISKINITNMKKAYDVLHSHEMRFENHQIYNQVITLMVNSFTNGKDVMTFLREIKSQGGEVTLALDINKRYRFCAYGKQFMIPSNITNADLLEIVGDVYALIDAGMFNKRVFDFPYSAGRYSFIPEEILEALPECENADAITKTINNIFVCDLGLDKIALLDENDKIINIINPDAPIADDVKAKIAKYVVLREGLAKPVFAGFVEFILTGENKSRLKALYSSTEEPNVVLADQIPYYYKPVPTIRRKEFNYLCGEIRRISPTKSKPRVYKNYFARDINAKLYGYGGVCPCCGYETGVLNCFVIKDFSIGLMNGQKEQKFNFSLYLCSNDSYAAGGWIIDDISIGGMSPFLWLEEIAMIDEIPPEFLYCRIKYRPQLTYDICEANEKGTSTENVFDGEEEIFDFVLTPMMAAKWVEDNAKR